jgi:hypothetical protein
MSQVKMAASSVPCLLCLCSLEYVRFMDLVPS